MFSEETSLHVGESLNGATISDASETRSPPLGFSVVEEDETCLKDPLDGGYEDKKDEETALIESENSIGSSGENRTRKLPFWKLVILTLAGCGAQMSWAVQIGYSTKTFLELGIPEKSVSYAWLAGPISGMVVQPIVGVVSDRIWTPIGRRKPFIVGGLFCIILGLVFFSNAEALGMWLGDTKSSHPIGSILATVAFFSLDFSINALQGPVRTLITDVCPSSQQNRGNSMYSLMGSLGNLIGSLLGATSLTDVFPFFGTDLRALYSITSILVILCCIGCIIGIREYRPSQEELDKRRKKSPLSLARGLWGALRLVPRVAVMAFLVNCLTWYAWFMTFIFVASWVGFLYGNPNAPDGSHDREEYDRGVRLGNLGLAGQAAVGIVYSLILPTMLRWKFWKASGGGDGGGGTKPLYFCATVLFSGLLISALFIHSGWLAILMISLTGIVWGNTLTVPWAIASRAIIAFEDKGLYMAVMNLSQCVPEIISSISGNLILTVWSNHAAPLVVGGIVAALGAPIILLMRFERRGDDSSREGESKVEFERHWDGDTLPDPVCDSLVCEEELGSAEMPQGCGTAIESSDHLNNT